MGNGRHPPSVILHSKEGPSLWSQKGYRLARAPSQARVRLRESQTVQLHLADTLITTFLLALHFHLCNHTHLRLI